MGAKQARRLDHYSIQPRRFDQKRHRGAEEDKLACRFPNAGHHAALKYLQKKRYELILYEQKLAREARESDARLSALLGSPPTSAADLQRFEHTAHLTAAEQLGEERNKYRDRDRDQERDKERFELASAEQRLLDSFVTEKSDGELQQEKVNAALLGATLGTAVILTAMGIQTFLTYTLESLMPDPQYKWLSLALIMLLYIAILYFFVAFFCV